MTLRAFAGFLVATIMAVATALTPSLAQEATRTIVTTPDRDYFGFDLRTERDVTLDECSQACIDDTQCKAFTYNPKVSWCFLKSDFNQLNPFVGAVAGKIVEQSAEPDIGAAPRLTFLSDSVYNNAKSLKTDLRLPPELEGQGQASILAAAAQAAQNGEVGSTASLYRSALSLTPDNSTLWLQMVTALEPFDSASAQEMVSASLNAYQLSRTTRARADALTSLAVSLEKAQSYRDAINAYKASLALINSKPVRLAFLDLKARQGFRVIGNTVDADSADPRACVQFSEPLVKTGVDYAPFVTLNGAPPKAMEPKDREICVEGLTHGERYTIALRSGLPSSVDEVLEAPVGVDVYIKDRSASVRFTGDAFVLPSTARRGIPLVSVNTASANLKLYRIGDRAMVPLIISSQFLTQLSGYGADQINENNGELVWQGSIDIASDLNKDVTTSFPVDEALPERKPGVYVLTASAKDARTEQWDSQATQWFVVSDTGLSTYTATDGLTVFARSLASAEPIADVELQLLARNNEILGTATTDSDGRATFTAGLTRGTASLVPAMLTAKNGDSDYVFLDLTRAGFDLSDRGVTGRAAPGEIDILAWTERGIYRPGETVHVSALARDINAMAIENLPLTFVFNRPDGVEDRRLVKNGEALGGYTLDLPIQNSAIRGTWTVQIYTDPKRAPIGSSQFMVDDFVPDRIEFDIASTAKSIVVGEPAPVTIDGRYLYGAPAAGLSIEGDVTLKPTRTREDMPGYLFGLADEEQSEDTRIALEDLPTLDEQGKATFDVSLSDVPSTTQGLTANVVVRMREAGGRAVERALSLPVKPAGDMIGILPEFSGDLSENSVGTFRVAVVDADGQKQAKAGLLWKLLKVNRDYQWYRDGGSWRYEPVLSTSQVANGTVDATVDGGTISTPVQWGRYRLEVETTDGDGPVSSVEFDAGYYVQSTSTETPDGLEIALDKPAYAVGETATLKVSPRFAGKLLVTVGAEKLVTTVEADIDEDGGEVSLPVTEDWGAGAYVTATLYRPGDAQESRMPMRAIGVKWLTVDPGTRKLAVKLTPPAQTLPRQPLSIPVEISGAGVDDEAYVTIAAVDVGILNLTRYTAPDPDGWYFGQRRLGLEIRDIYGRLIDGSLGATGRLRTGGDGGQMPLQGNPPKEKLVAFFAGPVKLDSDGKAVISFNIPQFNGTARIMAVAWSKAGVGHASTDVVIRDPLVVTASAPKFLAPGDQASLRLDIANTDAPAGDYTLTVTSNTTVTVDNGQVTRTLTLPASGKTDITLPLIAESPGEGTISMTASNASGLSLQQTLTVPVRAISLPLTVRRPIEIGSGKSLTVNADLLADSLVQGAFVSVNVTRAAAFDIPALILSLDRYPYGCAEQTTSRALPLLYYGDLAKQAGLPEDTDLPKRIQDAVYRVLSYQSSAGSFGLWAPGSGDLWLDAYVTDFLTRAREQKFDVPEQAMVQALDNLQNASSYDDNVRDRGNEIAYALYVLARNRKAAISDLRYYADTKLGEFPTPLAKAHLAAALSLYGDAQRAASVFEEAASMAQQGNTASLARSDYGSALRDGAAVLALAAESRPVPPVLASLIKTVAKEWDAKKYTSTQEQAWMLLAARALQQGDATIALNIDGNAHSGGFSKTLSGDTLLQSPTTITNTGDDTVWGVVTSVAAPVTPLPAGGDGFTIERSTYNLDGTPVNISEAKQNERYVVVLKATQTNDLDARVLIQDLLPAGLEIDNPSLVNSAQLSNFEWLGEVEPAHMEFRNDRFVAAFDRSSGDTSDMTLAYVVRAVTPGTYDYPAANIEDMYRPQFSARTATSRMEVTQAQE